MTENKYENFSDPILLEIAAKLNIKDFINFLSTNKKHRNLLNIKTIKFYCYHNNLPLLMPLLEKDAMNILKGQLDYMAAREYRSRILQLKEEKHTIWQGPYGEKASLSIDHVEADPELEADHARVKDIDIQIETLTKIKYQPLLEKAINNNLMAIMQKVSDSFKFSSILDIDLRRKAIKGTEDMIKNAKKTLGLIVDIYLAKTYLDYCQLLYKEINITRQIIRAPQVRIFPRSLTELLGIPSVPDNSEPDEIESCYKDEIIAVLGKAKTLVSELIKPESFNSFDSYNSAVLLRMLNPDNKQSIEQFIANLAAKITHLNDCITEKNTPRLG